MMQGEAAEGEVGSLVAKGELSCVGLDEKHFLAGWRGVAGDLKGLKLEIDGDDGDIVPAGLREAEQVAAVVAITGGEVDEHQLAGFVGQLVEDGLHRFFTAKGAIQAGEMFEVAPQGVLILVRQIHQLGLDSENSRCIRARMPIVERASPCFLQKKTKFLHFDLHFSKTAIAISPCIDSYRRF